MTTESDRSLSEVAKELGVSPRSLQRWRLGLDKLLGESDPAADQDTPEQSQGHNTGQRYPTEFKIKAVRMATRDGRSVAETARELGVSPSTLWRWRLEFESTNSAARTSAVASRRSGPPEDGSSPRGEASRSDPGPLDEVAIDPEIPAVDTVELVEDTADVLDDELLPAVGAAAEPSIESSDAVEVPAGPAVDSVETASLDDEEPLAAEAPVVDVPDATAVGLPPSADAEDTHARVGAGGPGERDEPEASASDDALLPERVSPRATEAHATARRSDARLARSTLLPGARPLRDPLRRRPVAETPPPPPPPPAGPPGAGGDTIDISELIGIVRRRAWMIAATIILFLGASVLLVLREVPTYRATAVLRVEGESREAVTQGFEAPARESDRYVNTLLSQVQLLRSRSLIASVVDSVGFRLNPDYSMLRPGRLEFVRVTANEDVDTLWLDFRPSGFTVRNRRGEARGIYGDPVRLAGVEFVLTRQPDSDEALWSLSPTQAAVDRLLANLRISPRTETNIVDVSFLHSDPARAQLVVNTLVTHYQQFEAQFAQERSRRRRIFLEEQLAQTDSSLANAQAQLRGFQTSAQTFDTRQELSAQQQNRLSLDIRRGELDAERGMYQELLGRLGSATDSERPEVLRTLVSAPGIAGNAAVSRIHEQLLSQRTVLDSLTAGDFGSAEGSPDVVRQRQLIASSEEELTGAIWSHVYSLDARAAALDALATRTSEELARLPYQLAEEARLEQIVQTYQNVSVQVRQELQRARAAEAATVGRADIIDLAALPYRPEPGTSVIMMGVGVILGLILGCVAAFLLERRNRFVQSRTEVEHVFHLPVLGVIPRATGPDLEDLVERLIPNGGTKGSRLPVGGEGRRTSQATEAYRLLRTNVLFAGWTGDVRTITVTSAAPREGKTLTATSLAASIAEEGVRVLLVDGDLWRGRVHEILELSESPGFSDILSGANTPTEAIRATALAGLDFLPRGTWLADPSVVANGAALKRALDDLGDAYDVLVVDSPPVLAAGSASALPAVSDGVLFLVRAGRTDREALREALRQLEAVGARVLGVVLNDPEDIGSSVEGGYRYQYEYAERGR